MIQIRVLCLLLVGLTACSSDAATPGDTDSDAGGLVDMRGTRYCEVLGAFLGDASVHVDVYTTEGLNDCPDAAWAALDLGEIKTQLASDVATLNGPRYWTLDSLKGSALQDDTVVTFGGLDMRKGGVIDLPSTDFVSLSAPYAQHVIHRTSAFHFSAGRLVYELTDAEGHTYDMQSYNVQRHPQDEASLLELGANLTLPEGWSYATRTLETELVLTATNGDATVIQDDYGNTYSMAR